MGYSKEQFMNEREQQEHDEYHQPSGTYEISPSVDLMISKNGAAEFHNRMRARIIATGAGALQYVEVIKFFDKVKELIYGTSTKDGDTELRKLVMSEISLHGKELTTPRGAKFELCETGTKYDFSLTPAWVSLDNSIKELQEAKKELETMLKGIPAGKEIVDPETGELFYGPAKSSTSSYKITISK